MTILPDMYPCKRDIFEATYEAASAAPGPVVFGDEEHVAVPRGLIGAACSAIEHKREGTNTLAELRRYTFGDKSNAISSAAPTALPVIDPGLDSLERAMESKTYQDGTTAFGPAPLPDVSPALWAKPLAKEVPELTVSLSDLGLERDIQAKADKGPRVTPADIEAEIASVHFFVASDAIQHENAVHEHGEAGWLLGATQQLTFCVIQLRNGFTVTGESACASPENFNAEIGRRIARENAINKVWPLLGFRLRDELARPVLTDTDAAADLAGIPRPGSSQ